MSGERSRILEPTVALSPSAQVLVRGESAIQFGINSTSAGIFPLEGVRPAKIVRVFAGARHPVTVTTLADKLVTAGLDPTTSTLLIDDLLNHGVLVPSEALIVGLIGDAPLARTISRVFTEMGIVVLKPSARESKAKFVEQLPFDTRVIAAGKMELIRNLVQILQTWPEVVPVTLVDSVGVIGPVRTQGQGPCVQCADLYHVQKDPEWRNIMMQVPLQPRPNPVVEYATAARLAALMLPRYPAPGVSNAGLRPGLVCEVDPFSGYTHESVMQPHPICPVCWESSSAQRRW